MSEKIRVLIVDDDFRVSRIHRDLVTSCAGFEALPPVRDARSARIAIRDMRPDLLLLDVYLPDGDGVEIGEESGIDRFVLSAADDVPTIRRALGSGALHYLIKPFDPRTLVQRLERYARYRNLLSSGSATQDTIDRAVSVLHGGAATSPARAGTQQLILDALTIGEASSVELAERVGVSRATAQRHLSDLAARGAVEVALRYGTAGRPEHRYRIV